MAGRRLISSNDRNEQKNGFMFIGAWPVVSPSSVLPNPSVSVHLTQQNVRNRDAGEVKTYRAESMSIRLGMGHGRGMGQGRAMGQGKGGGYGRGNKEISNMRKNSNKEKEEEGRKKEKREWEAIGVKMEKQEENRSGKMRKMPLQEQGIENSRKGGEMCGFVLPFSGLKLHQVSFLYNKYKNANFVAGKRAIDKIASALKEDASATHSLDFDKPTKNYVVESDAELLHYIGRPTTTSPDAGTPRIMSPIAMPVGREDYLEEVNDLANWINKIRSND